MSDINILIDNIVKKKISQNMKPMDIAANRAVKQKGP